MYMHKESSTLVFKEEMTDSFLKTFIAFANFADGKFLTEIKVDA
jgi:hypothetical protein